MTPDLSLEAEYQGPVCGVDEVGRGPWAGPVTACAVIFHSSPPLGLNDSKKLTAKRREALVDAIHAAAHVGLAEATVAEIDAVNILRASHLAMVRAIAALPVRPAHALIDGNRLPEDLPCPGTAVIKGDGRSASIAAASIIAKVARDDLMAKLSVEFPHYGWERNAGYGVKAHAEALRAHGVTPHHRRSFKPIHNMLCEEN
ncbi:MAG: ribonuclease HII [Pseudomonadota bacterium]